MLGDLIHDALKSVGITPGRVEEWLGRPCGCGERRDKLNSLHLWAARVARRGAGGARGHLARIIGVDLK